MCQVSSLIVQLIRHSFMLCDSNNSNKSTRSSSRRKWTGHGNSLRVVLQSSLDIFRPMHDEGVKAAVPSSSSPTKAILEPGAIPYPLRSYYTSTNADNEDDLDMADGDDEEADEEVEEDFLSHMTPLDLPEVLEHILSFVDDANPIPSEPAPIRRKPLSYQHALLIYHPDVNKAREAWAAARREDEEATAARIAGGTGSKETPSATLGAGSGLYSCLTVNRAFNDAAKRVMDKRATFTTLARWQRFTTQQAAPNRLRYLVLHKLRSASMEELARIGAQPQLEWVEFHVCPELVPYAHLLGSNLRRLALPGGTLVDDALMAVVSRQCPNLRVLDLRACEKVSDVGLRDVSRGCPRLKYLNVGRVNGGDRVTSEGVEEIAKNTDIDTLGLAGCSIGDQAMWAIAQFRGPFIER